MDQNGRENPAFDSTGETLGSTTSNNKPVGIVRPSHLSRVVPSDDEDGSKRAEERVDVGKEHEREDAEEEEYVHRCGWRSFKPDCFQRCNNPVGFLVAASIFAFVQGMTVNGLVYVCTTTLERRFNIPSVQSGFISSCYDFGVLLVVAFVTYFGEKAHKPFWVGVGAFFFSIGSILFSVPHYTTDPYTVEAVDIPTCNLNGTAGDGAMVESGLSHYLAVFIVAQLIHGISASGLYTLGVAFIDDNTPVKWASIFVGIFQGSSLLGPACGYLVGGVILEIYTDLGTDVSTLPINSESPLWIGAWWIGFLLTAAIAFLVAFPLLAFPRALPGAKKVAAEQRHSQVQKGAEFSRRSGVRNGVRDFPRAICCLFRNIPFITISLTGITEWFLLSSFATFGPKYLETQFSLTTSEAALLAGYVIIPAGLFGTIVGGVIVSKMKLQFVGMIRLALIGLTLSFFCIPTFIITCPNPALAGVTVQYTNTSLLYEGDEPALASVCNADCNCGSAFDPVCGSNGIIYYTPCHAGCLDANTSSAIKSYNNCSCIDQPPASGSLSSATTGKCPQSCDYRTVFIVVFFVMLMFTLMATVPTTMATLRCVSHDQRTFALGFQSVMFRAFGTIPSPVVYGALIDRTCILWEEDSTGGRKCWQYDNAAFSRNSLILALCLRCCSLVFLIVCLCLYKPGPSGVDGDGDVDVVGDEERKAEKVDGDSGVDMVVNGGTEITKL